ncbi:MAG: glycosyltransferase family 4 protein [Sulfitobacter sp.]
MTQVDIRQVQVIAPNFKRRLSGVTATVVRLVPVQAQDIAIAATGPVIPDAVPQIPLSALLTMPRSGPDGGPRVWHARRNVEMIGGLALKYLTGKKLKLVFTSASQRKQTGLTRWLIRQMDAVVATSDRTAGYLENPAQVIHHGIDLKEYAPAPDRTALRAQLGLPDATLIGCYGRIRPQKGTDAFVNAMIPVMSKTPDTHALIMGRAVGSDDTTFLADLKSRVQSAGLADRFHFLPEVPVEAMADWYRVLDLYVAPQRWEGFGLTPIEAMGCGVPVIATRVGAFDQIVVQNTGLLVEPGDIPALSKAICAAFDPPTRLEEWSQNVRPHVAQHFAITREAAELVSLYRHLLS